ncbi:MAG TPA: hypothetical protein VJ938_13495, partial [Acidimicrobiia bacterium]|nr:hypothetical protein [Acidimicrobiia bacterium]
MARTSGGFLGWALGAATILLLLWGLWSLADDAPDPPVPGIFGAAARPGTFAPETGGPADTSPMETTPTTPGATSTDSDSAVTDSPPDSPAGSSQAESTPLESPPTTLAATTTLPPTTTTTLAPLVLRPDGLDVADLGDSYEDALATVSARLGDPTEDTGWIDATSDFGICPGTVVRLVRWASLRLLFSDGPTEFGQDEFHFF